MKTYNVPAPVAHVLGFMVAFTVTMSVGLAYVAIQSTASEQYVRELCGRN